jgi:hypothetical protein
MGYAALERHEEGEGAAEEAGVKLGVSAVGERDHELQMDQNREVKVAVVEIEV